MSRPGSRLMTEKTQISTCLSACVNLQLAFSFSDKLFALVVKDMEAMDPSILRGEKPSNKKQKVTWFYLDFSWVAGWTQLIVNDAPFCCSQITTGLLLANSQVIFEKAEDSPLNLIGESLQHTSIIAEWPPKCILLKIIIMRSKTV